MNRSIFLYQQVIKVRHTALHGLYKLTWTNYLFMWQKSELNSQSLQLKLVYPIFTHI